MTLHFEMVVSGGKMADLERVGILSSLGEFSISHIYLSFILNGNLSLLFYFVFVLVFIGDLVMFPNWKLVRVALTPRQCPGVSDKVYNCFLPTYEKGSHDI